MNAPCPLLHTTAPDVHAPACAPLGARMRGTPHSALPASDAPTRRYTVLCVDGNPESRLVYEALLVEHTVLFAASAFDALRLINSTPLHGFITEYWLPDFSGVGLCREIRKADPFVPVVICTGTAGERERASGLRAGADACIAKPVDPEDLRVQLQGLLHTALLRSVGAKVALDAALASELQRQSRFHAASGETAHRLSASQSERIAKRRAHEAFIEAGGSRAYFDAWWPQALASARALHAET